MYGIICNSTTFDKIKNEGSVHETNGAIIFEGLIVGTRNELDDNEVLKCENKSEFIKTMILLDLGENYDNIDGDIYKQKLPKY